MFAQRVSLQQCLCHDCDLHRPTVHFASCRSISRTLLQFAASAKQLNVLAMYNLEQDVKHLEAYANNTGIPNLHEAFAEVRQLIALFLNPNVEQVTA